jgi:hypothetical protein
MSSSGAADCRGYIEELVSETWTFTLTRNTELKRFHGYSSTHGAATKWLNTLPIKTSPEACLHFDENENA